MPIINVMVSVSHPNKDESVDVPVFVDSGSEVSILPKSLAEQLGIETTEHVPLIGPAGTFSMDFGTARLRIFGQEAIFRVAISHNDIALIGVDFLDEFNLLVDQRNQLLLRRPEAKEYDVFVAHASEDKDQVARPLAEALRIGGFSVWFDEFEITVGDSITRKIGQGLASSRTGIIIFSPAFFEKSWPQFELNGMVAMMMDTSYKLLPVWHNVSKETLFEYNPSLADIKAEDTTTLQIGAIAQRMGEKIRTILNAIPLPQSTEA